MTPGEKVYPGHNVPVLNTGPKRQQCKHLDRTGIIPSRQSTPPLDCQTTDNSEIGIDSEIPHAGRRKRLGKWSLSPRKRFHTSPASCQSTLQQRRGSDGEHEWPGLGLLSYTELMLYLNRILRSGPGKTDWGFGRMGEDAIGSLCLSPHEVTLDKCPVFHYCLVNWPIEDLWPSLAYKLSEFRLWS